MTEFILVLTATPSQDEAQAIADASVDKQLAAAVQVIGPITSTYRWNNQKEKAQEWLCVIKTRLDLYTEVERLIQAFHSYELPGILAIPVIAGSDQYLAWYMSETKKESKEQILQALNEADEKLIIAATAVAQRGIIRKGEWGPREVLAHIVGWEAEATARIPALIAGEPPLVYDDDAFNAAMLTELGEQSFEHVRNNLRQTHQRLVNLLMKQEERIFTPGHNVRRRVKAMTEHSLEHAHALEELLR